MDSMNVASKTTSAAEIAPAARTSTEGRSHSGPKASQKKDALQESVNSPMDSSDKKVEIDAVNLAFAINEDTDEVVVKVLDKNSGEVIREIPSEELQELAKRLDEYRGKILDEVV